ncbi:hypothetical protein BO70DRAFT_393068 [Aspergillus heteromorphus CBS 117.55]|uniref:Uncharacterized protein n=1 Tax=Aspergillus heteromorphus CBS 117.55 TaxID=1448321 RepID=A0A317WU57_9EURO|nr:uncharacterized protein BO70DRAFT_393068 [Aspergillus heteromorphus CBS 117.55]PWY89869.1 hypothetical protein BO70DRAFT_393068 [Aspergillus heteromorphus CBS 117.55]
MTIMGDSLPIISLTQSTLVNRLGEDILAAAFISEEHFITLHPRNETLNFSLEIKWFFIQPRGDCGKFFAVPNNVTLNKGGVIVLKVSDDDSLPSVHHYSAETPEHAQKISLESVRSPVQEEPDLELAHVTNSAAHDLFDKLVGLADHPSRAKGLAPREAVSRGACDDFAAMKISGDEKIDGVAAAPLMRNSVSLQPESAPPKPGSAPLAPEPAPKKGDLDALMNLLTDNGKPPRQQVSENKLPKPPITNVKPTDEDPKVLDYYKDVKLVTGLATLFQEILRLKRMSTTDRKQPYGITDPEEANLAMKENADIAYEVIHGGLGGYYDSINMYTRTYKKEVTHSDLKIEFSKDIFQPFDFSERTLAEISGFIEQYISAIAQVKTDTKSTGFRNAFSKQIHQILKVNVGDDDNKYWVMQPRCQLLYMKIDSESYKETTKTCLKESTKDTFTFYMDYVIVEADINTEIVEGRRDKLTQAVYMISDKNVDEYVKQAGVANEVTGSLPKVNGM